MFKKNLHLCFFKIKCLPTSLSPPLTLEDEEEDHLHHNHITIHDNRQPFIMKNFNSVYDLSQSSSITTSTTTSDFFSSTSLSTTADSCTDDSETRPPDVSNVFSSDRFFVSSPGRSNSILDSSASSCSPCSTGEKRLVRGGVPVKKYSPDPYTDFRRSMQEMIEARERGTQYLADNDQDGVKDDWEYLHELLLCYLNLNPKQMHKFIIGAFSDLLVSKMSKDGQHDIRCSRLHVV